MLNKDIKPTMDNRAVDSGTFHPWAINSGNLSTVLSRNPMFEAENVKAHRDLETRSNQKSHGVSLSIAELNAGANLKFIIKTYPNAIPIPIKTEFARVIGAFKVLCVKVVEVLEIKKRIIRKL